MSANHTLSLPALLERVLPALPRNATIHLVGGAVRDSILDHPIHDLDFVVPSEALQIARRVANSLRASFYPLDEERETGRVVWLPDDEERILLDFSVYQGPDLASDLHKRDFTINAMAIDPGAPQTLIDPLGGLNDLRKKQLRACSANAITEDPVRVLRAVRLATAFDFKILPQTIDLIRQGIPLLPRISPERLRDELFKILGGSRVATSLRVLDRLGALRYCLPELENIKGVTQSPPHLNDVWVHSLEVVEKLESVLSVLALQPDPDLSASLYMGLISMRLGRYRQQIAAHFNTSLNPERSLRSLLLFSALYHDVAKPQTKTIEESGRIRFFDHDQVGAATSRARLDTLHLSKVEVQRVKKVIANHMRPLYMSMRAKPPTRRAIYRFFRDAGPAGIDVCLLSLADVLGTYGHTLPQEAWANHLDVVRVLMEAWWEQPEKSVSPPAMVSGRELIKTLGVAPGPLVGKMLEAIREAQATGKISGRQEALDLARSLLANEGDEDTKK